MKAPCAKLSTLVARNNTTNPAATRPYIAAVVKPPTVALAHSELMHFRSHRAGRNRVAPGHQHPPAHSFRQSRQDSLSSQHVGRRSTQPLWPGKAVALAKRI